MTLVLIYNKRTWQMFTSTRKPSVELAVQSVRWLAAQ